jgi:hypothetical protein
VGDLTALIKLVMLIEQFPSIDGSVDTGSEIIAEALIFSAFGAELLVTPVLDFLAKAVEVLNRPEVTTSFGLWLVVHDGENVAGMEKRSEGRDRWGEGVGRATVL